MPERQYREPFPPDRNIKHVQQRLRERYDVRVTPGEIESLIHLIDRKLIPIEVLCPTRGSAFLMRVTTWGLKVYVIYNPVSRRILTAVSSQIAREIMDRGPRV